MKTSQLIGSKKSFSRLLDQANVQLLITQENDTGTQGYGSCDFKRTRELIEPVGTYLKKNLTMGLSFELFLLLDP